MMEEFEAWARSQTRITNRDVRKKLGVWFDLARDMCDYLRDTGIIDADGYVIREK